MGHKCFVLLLIPLLLLSTVSVGQILEGEMLNITADTISQDSLNGTVEYNGAIYFVKDGEASLHFYSDVEATSFIIPDYVDYKGIKCPVTSIDKEAFCQNNFLASITIGNNIRTIHDRAFYWCSYLKSPIIVPENVVRIGVDAFGSPLSKEFIVEYGEKDLDWEICGNECMKYIEKVSLNRNTNWWRMGANDGLISVFPNLVDLYIGTSVKHIPNGMFYGSKKLVNVVLPSSITNIGEFAFANCGLKKITIPPSVEHIGLCAFSSASLENVFIESGNSECLRIGAVPFGNALTHVYQGRNICVLNTECLNGIVEPFENQPGMRSAVVGGDCTDLFWNDFKGCENLTDVTIKGSVETISYTTFKGCNKIKMLRVENVNPPKITPPGFEDYAFEDEVYSNAVLSVPENSREVYKATLGWKKFFKIETTGMRNVISDKKQSRVGLMVATDNDITISGLNDGEVVTFYSVGGVNLGSAKAQQGVLHFNKPNESIVIAKIKGSDLKIAIR